MNHSSLKKNTWLISLVYAALLLPFYTSLHADEQKISPLNIEGAIKVNAISLIELAHSLDDLIIIDSRIKSDRRQGYIPDSISLPDIDTDCLSLGKLIGSYRTPVLFYCNGPKCGRSEKAVRIAKRCGYNNIYWYRGGFEEWLDEKFPVYN